MIGMSCSIAVIRPFIVIANPPSPHTATTGRSGCTSLAASAAGMANPIGPEPAACRKPPGRLGLVEMRHQDAVLAGVAGDDRVVRQVAHQLADRPAAAGSACRRRSRPARRNSRALSRCRATRRVAGLAPPVGARAAPPRTARRRICAASPSTTCLGREIPRRVARLDVDLDENLPRRVEQLRGSPRRCRSGSSFEPTTSTRSASPRQAFAAAVPNVPNTPSASGCVSAKQPLPAAVVATGIPAVSASSRSCS